MKTTGSPLKIKTADQLLQSLSLVDKPLDIPGNFRAKQRRKKHDDSKLVFPNPRKKESDTFKTHYNNQFRSKNNSSPSSARPCSPTRRNNPHPSKNFLNWRIPSRVFDYGMVKTANVSFLKSNVDDSHQRFYDDYSGRKEIEDQLDPRQLMDIAKSYAAVLQKQRKSLGINAVLPGLCNVKKNDKTKLGLYSPPTSPIGIKFPTVTRSLWSPEQSSDCDVKEFKKVKSKISPSSQCLKSQFVSWYDANPMDKSETKAVDALDDSVGIALDALKPEALLVIENWLMNASDEERQIAMKFIEAIILASVEESKVSKDTGKKVESANDTVPLQFLSPFPTYQNPTQSAHHHNHNRRKACEICQKKELESALQQLQAIASLPKDVPAITELLNPLHPSFLPDGVSINKNLHENGRKRQLHKEKARLDRPKFKANKGSLFMNSKRPSGRHFTIHPEWH